MEQYYATIFKFTSPLLGFAKIPETVTSQGRTFTVRGFGDTGWGSSDEQNVTSLTFQGDVTM
jgi:hypothetical protein